MRILVIISFFIAIAIMPKFGIAQVEVKISNEIVVGDNNEKFYLHQVNKDETLYSISKAYKVSVEDILKHNDLKDGLKEGQKIKIAVPDAAETTTVLHEEQDTIAPEGYVYHRVEKGETLYRIMFNYQVKLEDLEKCNPDLTSNIAPGQLILIPTKEKRIAVQAALKYDSLTTYKLKKRDNYYRLEKKFKLNQQQLEQLNPQLKTLGIQKGMEINVPYLKETKVIPEFAPIQLDSVKPKEFYNNPDEIIHRQCKPIVYNRHIYKIGFLIPLYANLDKEIRVENDYLIKKSNEYKSFRFVEFLQGAMLAIDSLEKLGFKTEVYVWDTQAKESQIDSIVQLEDFKQLDLLIGPFYSKNVKRVRTAASVNHIKLVDLFSSSFIATDSLTDHFILKPNEQSNYNALVKYIGDSIPNYRISIIHQSRDKELARLGKLKKALYANYSGIDTNMIFVYDYKNGGMSKLMSELSSTSDNIIFNLVDDEARVSNFLRQLNLKKKDISIIVMAQDKHWSKYKTLELDYLSALRYTCAIDYHVNYSDSISVIPFDQKFYNTNKRIPGKLGYVGYDLAWYFGSALFSYGTNFSTCFNQINIEGMHSNFIFTEIREGVYRNKAVRVIQYDNYQKIRKN